MSDELTDLVAAARGGSEAAWNDLVDRFGRLVWHVVRGFRMSDAAAEDVYQTTWLRLAEHLDRIRDPASLGGWLARTARNECLRVVKLGGRENLRSDLDLGLADPEAPVGHTVEIEDRNEILWQAFAALPEPCQRLLRLLMAEPPLSYDRVSELLDIAVGSIGPTRGRCLAKLRSSRGVDLLGYEV